MKRNFEMFCVKGVNGLGEVNEDMIGLCFVIDDKIVDNCELDNIGDILIESSKMLNRNCEKYNFDGRRDKLKVNLSYEW